MTEQEIIAAAKTNWLAWQGLKELQPEVAAWMEEHLSDLRFVDADGMWPSWMDSKSPRLEVCYRLRPDYEPVRWWFDVVTAKVSSTIGTHEVTAEYADYLRTKPDGEWELRKPDAGDLYKLVTLPGNATASSTTKRDLGPQDRGYRWCKPKADIVAMKKSVFDALDKMNAATAEFIRRRNELNNAMEAQK
jgi:hypothetical protein